MQNSYIGEQFISQTLCELDYHGQHLSTSFFVWFFHDEVSVINDEKNRFFLKSDCYIICKCIIKE